MNNPALNPAIEKRFLNRDEKVLWKSDRVGYSCSKLLILMLVSFLGIIITFPIYAGLTVFVYFLLSYSIFISVLLILVLLFLFYKFLVWLTRYITVLSLYLTDKRIMVIEPGQRRPYAQYTNYEDIVEIKSLKVNEGEYTKYLLKSNFYYFWNSEFLKFNKTYRIIYLNQEGLEILTKILKEKSSNARISL